MGSANETAPRGSMRATSFSRSWTSRRVGWSSKRAGWFEVGVGGRGADVIEAGVRRGWHYVCQSDREWRPGQEPGAGSCELVLGMEEVL